MSSTFIAMLIWIGTSTGQPAVLTGFNSMNSCQGQRKQIEREFSILNDTEIFNVRTSCLELDK